MRAGRIEGAGGKQQADVFRQHRHAIDDLLLHARGELPSARAPFRMYVVDHTPTTGILGIDGLGT
jgi:hypothetical protein